MKTFDKLRHALFSFKHSKFIAIIAVYFSLLYHTSFLIVFHALNIMPMFYFNIFSVTLFSACSLIVLKLKHYDKMIFVCYFEVVLHQFLGDYYLGGQAGFHFFILLIGIIPFLTLKNHFGVAVAYGVISSILFTLLEVFEERIPPVYETSQTLINVIKTVNVSLTAFVIVLGLLIYAYIVWHIEHQLEDKVLEKTLEASVMNEKRLVLQNHIINSLASLVENRDTDTGEHIQRTSAYVEIIGQKALKNNIYPEVITEDFVNLIKHAAPMHDIGKIMVPDSVLKKPGKLTDEEFEQMKLHTTQGGRIINEVIGISDDVEYIKTASDMASGHHERWDGTGYPYGLVASEIPVSARIMAIADVFDALVSPRCYKKPMPKEKAYEIIQEESGTHFDPVLVELFVNSKAEVDEILNTYTK